MLTEAVTEFFQALGFEKSDIADEREVLTFLEVDLPPAGYALISDEEGMPLQSLEQRLIFAYYRQDGAYQWSVGFKNASAFQAVWPADAAPEQKLAAIRALSAGPDEQ